MEIPKSLPREQMETSSVRKASYSGIDRKGGSAATSIDGIISKLGTGGTVKGLDNQKEKG
tara:strand:- start:209 stop:388 length:180 start_codon:yes stop_codon:yes gene_type:complete